jgi:hypothetical protein
VFVSGKNRDRVHERKPVFVIVFVQDPSPAFGMTEIAITSLVEFAKAPKHVHRLTYIRARIMNTGISEHEHGFNL